MDVENNEGHEIPKLTELPEEIKEIAIRDLEESLGEGYKKPTTNVEKVNEDLYKTEGDNNNLGLKLDTIFIAYWPLYRKLLNDDFGYPPGDTSVEKLKELIKSTVNRFMESRCWELLKQRDELNKLKGTGEDVGYWDFIQEYNREYDLDNTDITPPNSFSRVLSRSIINSINPEDKNLVDKLTKYTYTKNNCTLLHLEVLHKIESEEEKKKVLAICHEDTYCKDLLERPKKKIPEDVRNQYEDLAEEAAESLLSNINDSLYERD